MKSSVWKIGTLLAAGTILLSGCGEQMVKLTSSEENAIASYSAHVIAEFNTNQQKGYLPLSESDILKYQEREEGKKEESEQIPEETVTEPENGSQGNSQEPDKEQVTEGTLSQALGLGQIKAEYKGFEVRRQYVESDAYELAAKKGNKLLILHINLKNTSGKKQKCDMLEAAPEFVVTVNEDSKAKAMTTILLNDLGTYAGSIKAGKTVRTVLIFEMSNKELQSVTNMALQVKLKGNSTKITLK